MQIRLLPRAEEDLLSLPPNIQEIIIEKIELLYRFPKLGMAMVKAYKNYRCLLAFRNHYRIIYKIKSEDLLEIAYIRHCRRQMFLRAV